MAPGMLVKVVPVVSVLRCHWYCALPAPATVATRTKLALWFCTTVMLVGCWLMVSLEAKPTWEEGIGTKVEVSPTLRAATCMKSPPPPSL